MNDTHANGSLDYERRFLREELSTNKHLVFERALAIAAIGLAFGLIPKEAQGIQLVGIPVIGALAFNLWLSVNRLKSNSRIVAYIQLFHEADKAIPWVGWETALRLFRTWSSRFPERLAQVQEVEIEQYDNLSFYKPIFGLHLSMIVLVSILLSVVALSSEPFGTPFGPMPQFIIPSLIWSSQLLCVFGRNAMNRRSSNTVSNGIA